MTAPPDDLVAELEQLAGQGHAVAGRASWRIQRLTAENKALREENERLKRDVDGIGNAASKALARLMSDISEDCYCAGWLIGNEFRLWAAVTDPKDDRQYGFGKIRDEDVAELARLSELCGGWIQWKDGVGETFVPIDEWRSLYAARLAAGAANER